MKKLLSIILTLVVVCGLFAGCSSNNSSASTPVTSSEPSQSTSPSEDPAPSESSTPEPTPTNPPVQPSGDTGTSDDPFDISELPESLAGISENHFYQITGPLSGTPGTIVKTTESDEYRCTISVPVIPESLKSFADDRGDNYYLLYVESKTTGSSGAILVFYQESTMIKCGALVKPGYFDAVGILYGFASSNGAILMADTNLNIGFANDQSPYIETDTALDSYSSTSFTPSDEHIETITSAANS